MVLSSIELMLHLSRAKQMYSQPIQLVHVVILSTFITTERVDFNRDSTAKNPCWLKVLNLLPSDPDLLGFAPMPSLRTGVI